MKTKIVLSFLGVVGALGVFVLLPTKAQAATYMVTNTNDSGAGSLRDAITSANIGGGHTIAFNIGGAGIHTITLSSALPDIVAPVTIDGTTQTGTICGGTSTRPQVAINFNDNTGLAIRISASSSFVRGLAFYGAADNEPALTIEAHGSGVRCNFFGTDDGTTFRSTNTESDWISLNAHGVTIGGATAADFNLISTSGWGSIQTPTGVTIFSPTIRNNYIGTNISGTASLGGVNGARYGMYFDETEISGMNIRDNLVSGHRVGGIMLYYIAPASGGITIAGNKINTNVAGDDVVIGGTSSTGVEVYGDLPYISGYITIGGSAEADRNIIAGVNSGRAIYMYDAGGYSIENNYINTSADGTTLLADGASTTVGIYTTNSGDVPSGNALQIRNNVINAGGRSMGIQAYGSGTFIISDNLIGVNATETAVLSDLDYGVYFYGSNGPPQQGQLVFQDNVIAGMSDPGGSGGSRGLYLGSGHVLAVMRNSFGTDSTHTQDFGGRWFGIEAQIFNGTHPLFGSADPEDGNYFKNLESAFYSNYLYDVVLGSTIVGMNVADSASFKPINNAPPAPVTKSITYNADDTTTIVYTLSGADFDAGDYYLEIYSNPSAINAHNVFDATNYELNTTLTKTGSGDQDFTVNIPEIVLFPTVVATDMDGADYVVTRSIGGFTGTPIDNRPGSNPGGGGNQDTPATGSTSNVLAATGVSLPLIVGGAVILSAAGFGLYYRKRAIHYSAK